MGPRPSICTQTNSHYYNELHSVLYDAELVLFWILQKMTLQNSHKT